MALFKPETNDPKSPEWNEKPPSDSSDSILKYCVVNWGDYDKETLSLPLSYGPLPSSPKKVTALIIAQTSTSPSLDLQSVQVYATAVWTTMLRSFLTVAGRKQGFSLQDLNRSTFHPKPKATYADDSSHTDYRSVEMLSKGFDPSKMLDITQASEKSYFEEQKVDIDINSVVAIAACANDADLNPILDAFDFELLIIIGHGSCLKNKDLPELLEKKPNVKVAWLICCKGTKIISQPSSFTWITYDVSIDKVHAIFGAVQYFLKDFLVLSSGVFRKITDPQYNDGKEIDFGKPASWTKENVTHLLGIAINCVKRSGLTFFDHPLIV